jgi:hypothetical protein
MVMNATSERGYLDGTALYAAHYFMRWALLYTLRTISVSHLGRRHKAMPSDVEVGQ